jgi:hypothetical protein
MSYTDLTLKKLFALSGNECAFPSCTEPIVDTEIDLLVGEICHIKAKSPNGPRYDPSQTDAERNGYENLLVMCGRHNKTVDDPRTRERFPVEVLQQYKREHEARHQNNTVSKQALNTFVSSFQVAGSIITTYNQSGGQNAHQITNVFAHPAPRKIVLTPVAEYLRTSADNQARIDYYDFRVGVRNDGQTTVKDYSVVVEMPGAYANTSTTSVLEVIELRTPQRCVYRRIIDERNRVQGFHDMTVFPGLTQQVMQLSFMVTFEQYYNPVGSVMVRAYAGDEFAGEAEFTIASMLNPERVEMLIGPLLKVLKELLSTAKHLTTLEMVQRLLPGSCDLTDVTMQLGNKHMSGITLVGIQVENAHSVAKALAKMGWIVIEDEERLTVKLTEAGVQMAQKS